MSMVASYPFRFDAINHEYIDLSTGESLQHITGMLLRTGWIDDQWFTEESSERGTAVHRLTADYDLEALDPAGCVSRYRPYLLAHIAAMAAVRPAILAVEEPLVHPGGKWGGRPDREVRIDGVYGPLEVKTGDKAKGHQIQTALQALLLEQKAGIPAAAMWRWCLYLKPNGRYKLEPHRDPRDLVKAREVLNKCLR